MRRYHCGWKAEGAIVIRVAIVDDQDLVREGFSLILGGQVDIEVVGEAADGAEAVEVARRTRPDVILMDIRMPHVDGLVATKMVTEALPTSRVLLLTTFDLDEYAFSGLRAGASGFLVKDAKSDELVRAVRAVHSGDAVFSSRLARRFLDLFGHQLPSAEGAQDASQLLSRREFEVLLAVAAGLSNTEIATRLFLTESTVKTHVGKVLAKLGLRDRVHAVIYAYEHNLISRT